MEAADKKFEKYAKAFVTYVEDELETLMSIRDGPKSNYLGASILFKHDDKWEYGVLGAKAILDATKINLKSILEKCRNNSTQAKARKHVRNLESLLTLRNEDREKFRTLLVDGCFDVFHGFERQFVAASSDLGPDRATRKLAKCSARRALAYFTSHELSDAESVSRAIYLGGSSDSADLFFEDSKRKFRKLESFFEKPGIVIVENGIADYYERIKEGFDRVEKYKFRRLLGWESDANLKKYFKPVEAIRVESYDYVMDTAELRKIRCRILCNLKAVSGASNKTDEAKAGPIWFDVEKLVIDYSRDENWTERIFEKFETNLAVVITGLSGIGKTTLASRFAHEYKKSTCNAGNVIWVNAESDSTLKASVYKLCSNELTHIKLKDGDKQERRLGDIFEDVYAHFIRRDCLFVFDRADKYSDIEHALPLKCPCFGKKMKILITSTNSREDGWESDIVNVNVLPLVGFSTAESVRLLKNILHISDDSQDEDLGRFAEKFKNHPIAIRFAAKEFKRLSKDYTNREHNYTVMEYISNISVDMQEYLKSHLATQLKKIREKNNEEENNGEKNKGEIALRMVQIMAYFSWNQIPEDFFLINLCENDRKLQISVTKILEEVSMVKISKNMLNIHEIIQDVIKLIFIEDECDILRFALVLLRATVKMLETKPLAEKVLETKPLAEEVLETNPLAERMRYISHIISVWNHASKYESIIKEFIQKDVIGKSPHVSFFHLLARHGTFELTKLVLDSIDKGQRQTMINMKTKQSKKSSFHYAVESGNKKTVSLFMQYVHKDGKNSKTSRNYTPLHLAVKNSYVDIVNILLENDVDVDVKTSFRFTALHFAAIEGNMDIVEKLICRMADVNAETNFKFTPLYLAAENGNFEVVQYLLELENIKVNCRTNYSDTPLHAAILGGHTKVVKALLLAGADLNIQNKDGFTPLHVAVTQGRIDIVEMILNSVNIDMSLKTTQGKTPFDIAQEFGNEDIIEVMKYRLAWNISDVVDGDEQENFSDECDDEQELL